jgi:hypothetical protein
LGDYPEMKGDQMLWYVFNDNGPSHDQTGSMPLGVQVGFTAYAYKQNNVLDNIIFYEYNVTNKSGADLDSFVLGIWSDLDIGYGFDDFIGFDSVGSMGIAYNGDNIDGSGAPGSYGDSIPMAGIKVLRMPEDSCGSATPAGSFMYYNNSSSPIDGNPSNTVQFSNYLRSTWRNGQHLTNDFQGPGITSTGIGAGPSARYVYSGNPSDPMQWSECASGNAPADRRFIIGSQPLSFQAGSTLTFATALVVASRKLNNACPGVDFTDIRNMSDSAQTIFCNPPIYTSVKETKVASKQLKLYPNPANSTIYIDAPAQANEHVSMFDGLGRRINIAPVRKGNRVEIDINALANGVYYITYSLGDNVISNSFIKE